MTHRIRLNTTLALVALILACHPLIAEDKAEKQTEEKKAEKKTEKDRYAIPEKANGPELVKFIREITSFRPTNALEQQLHIRRLPGVLKTAAAKIVKLEKDEQSAAYGIGRGILFELQIHELDAAAAKQQTKLVSDLTTYFKSRKNLAGHELAIAMGAAKKLEAFGKTKQAASAYEAFAKIFAKSTIPQIAAQSKILLGGAGRRLSLLGNTMQLTGTTVKGDKFDLKSLKGKVVLVDFWATWCGPCIQEYPNILAQYQKYHDKGFEVVGISLDDGRSRLDRYLSEKNVPWITLHEAGQGGQHPAAMYYGISSIPQMILIGRDGKVISMHARGPQLVELLNKEFSKK